MSNTAFNFLSNSYLTKESKDNFLRKSLSEIEQELDNYRSYLNSSKVALDNECINDNKDSIAISDFRSSQKLPKMEEIIQKSLFLNQFVIDDPIQSVSFKNIDRINNDRQARGFEMITENDAKENLWKRLQYMKSLLPGVNVNVGYIKFYPLSKEPTNELLSIINIPDLSFPNEYPEIYEWFLNKLIVKTIDDDHKVIDLVEPCKQLGISFQNDGNGLFLPAFMNGQFQNVIPALPVFTQWKNEEIIKSIRDRYIELVRKNEFRLKFGAIVSTESEFEFDFLNSTIIPPPTLTTETKILRVLTKIKMPSLASTSFEKIMEVRQFFDNVFENFRTQLKEDIIRKTT